MLTLLPRNGANYWARLFLCLAILTVCADAPASDSYLAPEVRRVTVLTHNGGRVDWSPQNKIAFDRRGDDGYYQVWVMDADGGNQHCLTCGALDAPTKNKGNPAWHPSGDYIVFQGQKDKMLSFLNHLAEPGRGVGNNLWLMSADGRRYWEIVDVAKGRVPAGILHPHFSPDGNKLMWTQLLKANGKLGEWELHVADFAIHNGEPVLSNDRAFQPGPVKKFFESHGFFPGGTKVLYAAETATGLSEEFSLELATGVVQDLTNSPEYWSEHGQISPDGQRIVWATNRGIPGVLRYLNLWTMNSDGTDPHMLIDFHQPGTPITTSGIGPGDSSWSPNGKSLAVYVIGDKDETKGNIELVEFAR